MFQDLGLRNLHAIGLVQPWLGGLLYSEKPRYNHLYSYVRNNPLSLADPTGLLDEGPKGGGGGGFDPLCPLVAQFRIGFIPNVPGGLSIWYCVYDCNKVCPGTNDKMITEIQWDTFPHTGCLKVIPRPPGM
jgi:hypothetical protein